MMSSMPLTAQQSEDGVNEEEGKKSHEKGASAAETRQGRKRNVISKAGVKSKAGRKAGN